MKLSKHIAVTLPVSAVVYCIFHSLPAFFGSLIGGLLIDIDHLFDYFIHEGVNFRLYSFFEWCYKNKWKKLILFFHSIELVLVFWLCILYFHLGLLWIGIAIGMTQHLILDAIFNIQLNPMFYFFILRFRKGFERKYILRGDGKT